MVKDPSILIIGKHGSGKTEIINNILQFFDKRDNNNIYIVSPTERMNSYYKYKYPGARIEYQLNDKLLTNILYNATTNIKQLKQDNTVVLDDCLRGIESWKENKELIEILMNGRHYRIKYMLSIQNPIIDFSDDLRLNFDYIFLFREDFVYNKKKIWDCYASIFPTFMMFNDVFEKCTEDYCAMVIDNKKPSYSISEKIFYFKAYHDNTPEKINVPKIIEIENIPNEMDNLYKYDIDGILDSYIIHLTDIKKNYTKLVNENLRLNLELKTIKKEQ
jgi:energy-coupling factor transporter ATP-binding protein EcfA2